MRIVEIILTFDANAKLKTENSEREIQGKDGHVVISAVCGKLNSQRFSFAFTANAKRETSSRYLF